PDEALPMLFDVYVQADPSIYRRFGGTGLGLPLCRRIARLMQGGASFHGVSSCCAAVFGGSGEK
ncbi:hypothetical protein G3N61_12495, partial [Burkholderia sp. Ac-20349]|nr:hypothetical protein [Burkholderia sp. Ac-20349]